MYDLSAVYMTCLIWNLFFQSSGVAAVEFFGGLLLNSCRVLVISRNLLVNSRGKLLNYSILLVNSYPSTGEFSFFTVEFEGYTVEFG